MELLQKFAVVEIQAHHRITKMDKDYCEQHQKAYEAAITSFQELAFFWEDMNKAQKELLDGSKGPIFCDYLASDDGPSISRDMIDCHINTLHTNFIMNLTYYFNSTYHVSVDSSEISRALICQRRYEIVRKRRRNFVVFWRGGNKIRCFPVQKACSRFAASGA